MTIALQQVREAPSEGLDFDTVRPIHAERSEIEAAVADAELPSLLAALAMLTGDERLISEELRPPLPPMGATIAPQGGMSQEMQAKARALSVAAILSYRNAGCPAPAMPDAAFLDRIMKFLAKGAGSEYLPLLRHELGLPRDIGAPTWRKSELAPERDFSVAVIGAGLSGVAAAYRLRQAGVPFVVFDKNPDVGGVWWSNTYPGCRLDTPNFAYSLSFAQKPDWPQQFSRQPEIRKYIADVADRTKIRSNIRFNTEVVAMTWDEVAAKWNVKVRRADGTSEVHAFNAVIAALGLLTRPLIPEIPGLETFGGAAFHSAEWPADVSLEGKRVAVIGTGASAYQIVPSIVDRVARLSVFQRNPPWMLATPTYHDDLKAGMAWLLRHIPFYGRWYRFWQFWIAAEGRFPLVQVDEDWQHPVSVGRANERLRQECLAMLEAQFADRPDLLEKMTPAYPPGAKRMLRDNGVWAAALKREHTSLVTAGIARIEKDAVVASDGERYPADVIVFATGFTASDYLAPVTIVGRQGKNLHDWWAGDCRAYLGVTVPGFPNMFMTAGPNTGLVVNGSAIFSAECAVEYSLSAIKALFEKGAAAMDCRMDLFEAFNDKVDRENLTKAWGVATVSSWYRNSAGRASQTWPFPLLDYWRVTQKVEIGDYELIDPNNDK